jgi:hypothetical protein
MTQCSPTRSEASKNWPEGIIHVKITMNPYIYAMALEEAYKQGMKPWELINVALWEKIGKPDHDTLMNYAANVEIDEDDPKWLKRLKITAQHEVAVAAVRAQRADDEDRPERVPHGDNGD